MENKESRATDDQMNNQRVASEGRRRERSHHLCELERATPKEAADSPQCLDAGSPDFCGQYLKTEEKNACGSSFTSFTQSANVCGDSASVAVHIRVTRGA